MRCFKIKRCLFTAYRNCYYTFHSVFVVDRLEIMGWDATQGVAVALDDLSFGISHISRQRT